MPCYDKKLEASRTDFYNDVYRTRDVDCVITTGELEKIALGLSINFEICPVISISNDIDDKLRSFLRSEGSSSGGYLSFLMRFAVKTIFDVNLTCEDICKGGNGILLKPGRNPDFSEVFFTPDGHDSPALKFAYCYGFKNLQTVIRKIKQKSTTSVVRNSQYHFIEVMACPSGCINGGGQLKSDTAIANSDWIKKTENAYFDTEVHTQMPENNPFLPQIFQEWLYNQETIQNMLHTQYHAIDNTLQNGLGVKW
jgi:iron only hydrogenase large subunit-like protein